MAATAAERQQTLIHEVRNKEMVSMKDEQSPVVRIARFLKPCADDFDQAVGIPNTLLLFEIFSHDFQDWPTKVVFKGWNSPQKKWKEWVESLAGKHGAIWNQTGICDAIMSSIYDVRFNSDLVLGLCEFWCPETNTFVFPWGEATVTLEDIMLLGGFPVLGEEIRVPLSEELVAIEEEMNKQRTRMCRSRAKKADHSTWIKHFMEEERESKFEHVAFLSLWLSRYVFPSLAEESIGKHVFLIAAALSQGKPIAIAPAVLGNLYKDLRLLNKNAMDFEKSISLSSPFQLLQLWAFEHFPLVGPTPNLLNRGEPRVARWNKLYLKINQPLVRSALQLAENFIWRPYAADLENWRHRSYYKETEQSFLYRPTLDGELRSFFQCLKASDVVGIECRKEKYLPNRVAMQFGMDQDIPADVSCLNFADENISFIVPPRSFEPGLSGRYMNWWKDMMLNREGAIKKEVVKKRNEMMLNASSSIKEKGSVAFRSPIASHARKRSNGGCNISIASNILKGLEKLTPVSIISDIKQKRDSGFPDIPSVIEEQICSDSSDDDDDHVPSTVHYKNNYEGSPAMNSRLSSPGQAKKSKASIGFSSPKSCGNFTSSPVSTKSSIEHKQVDGCPETPSQILSDSSNDDHFPIATSFQLRCGGAKSTDGSHQDISCNRYKNAVSPISSIDIESCRKRKFHATSEGILQEEVTKKHTKGVAKEVNTEFGCSLNEPIDIDEVKRKMKTPTKGRNLTVNGVAKEVKTEFGCSLNERLDIDEVKGKMKTPTLGRNLTTNNGVAKVVKIEVGCSLNEPIDIDEVNGKKMKTPTKGKNLTKGVAEVEKQRKAGASLGNPIDIDNYKDPYGFQKGEGNNLQERVEKLERLLRVIPD